MKIGITGGTGFIGSEVVRKLVALGHDVTLLTYKSSRPTRITDIIEDVNIIVLSGVNEEQMQEMKLDTVINMATCYMKDDQGSADRSAMFAGNVSMSNRLLELCISSGVKRFVNAGTWFEYARQDTPLNEHSRIDPYNYYASTKLSFQEILKYTAKRYGLSAATLCVFPVYGGRDNPGKLIPIMIKTMLEGGTLNLSPGGQQWNFTYVDDMADAFVSAALRDNLDFDTYNIGINKTVSLIEIGNILQEIIGTGKLNFGAQEYRKDEVMHVNCTPTISDLFLNWRAKTSIEEGLKLTVEEYKKWKSKE